jgi:hypothetical protein
MTKEFNLLKLKHPKRRLWLGLACIGTLSAFLFYDYFQEGSLHFEGFYVMLVLFGIQNLYEARGFSFNQLFGESYLKVDSKKIHYKPKLFKPEQVVSWDEVAYLKDYGYRIFLVQHNSESVRIDLKGLETDQLKQIREAFASLAKEKQLEVKPAKLKRA